MTDMLTLRNPATEEVIHEMPHATVADMDAAIDKAILGTINGSVTLAAYELALQKNPPNVWQNWTVGLIEVKNNIGGYVPQATGYGRSELWYKK